MDPFDLNVDIDLISDKNDDDDDDEEKKSSGNSIMKMTKRKVSYEDVEIEGFGDDDHKSEKQETTYLPLEGGLAGLISNLSGVKLNQLAFGRASSIMFSSLFFRVRTVQISELSSVSDELLTDFAFVRLNVTINHLLFDH